METSRYSVKGDWPSHLIYPHAQTGELLRGCVVEFRCWGGRRDVGIPEKLRRPDPVTTGVDGRFSVRVLAREDYQVGLGITLVGRWPRTGRWYHMLPGEITDIGRIKLHKGVYAVGKVVDTTGQPVPNVNVGIDELPLYLGVEKDKDDKRPLGERLRANADSGTREFHLHANKVRYGSTGVDGSFKSRDALPPGTHELKISGRGLTLVKPKTITIPEKGPMQPVTIVVKQQPFLSGVVVDEKGEPVYGVSLGAELRRSGRMASGRTRRDGTFEIYRVANSPDRVRLRVDDPGPCERCPPTAEFAWGKTGIKIVLQRALTVEVTVVEAGTGKAVEDFAVRWYPTGGGYDSRDRRIRLSGTHKNGVLAVDRVRRGHGRIHVIPKDMQLLPAHVDIVGKDGLAPLRIEVKRLVPMKLLVLDAKGKPVDKVQVRVIVPGSYVSPRGQTLNDPRSDNLGSMSSDLSVTFDEEIFRTNTDAGGQCIVYGVRGRDDLILGLGADRRNLQRIEGVSFGPQHLSRKVVLEGK